MVENSKQKKNKKVYPKSNQSSQVILYYVAVYSVEHFGQ